MTLFAGMGVEPSHEDGGFSDAEFGLQVGVQNVQHGVQQWAGDGGGDVFEWEVGSGKGNA